MQTPATKTGVLDMEMQPKSEPSALPATVPASDVMALIERLAKDPTIDVGKLEKIIDLQRGLQADRARAEYFAAFSAMSEELPVLSKRGEILNRNGQVQSKYSLYEDIQRVVKPILRKHGFTVSHKNHPDTTKEMVTTTFLVHRAGHAEESTFKADSDTSGSKNAVQGLGSVAQYAKRYNLVALLDLEITGKDDDGQAAGQKPAKDAPAGFYDWWDNIVAVADEGTEKLFATWKASKEDYRDHTFATNKKGWDAIKGKAAKATKDAKAKESARG